MLAWVLAEIGDKMPTVTGNVSGRCPECGATVSGANASCAPISYGVGEGND